MTKSKMAASTTTSYKMFARILYCRRETFYLLSQRAGALSQLAHNDYWTISNIRPSHPQIMTDQVMKSVPKDFKANYAINRNKKSWKDRMKAAGTTMGFQLEVDAAIDNQREIELFNEANISLGKMSILEANKLIRKDHPNKKLLISRADGETGVTVGRIVNKSAKNTNIEIKTKIGEQDFQKDMPNSLEALNSRISEMLEIECPGVTLRERRKPVEEANQLIALDVYPVKETPTS